jgi:peptide/nickel transport system permease protein
MQATNNPTVSDGRPRPLGLKRLWRSLRPIFVLPTHDWLAMAGLIIYVLFVLVAIFADWIAPYDPLKILLNERGRLLASLPPLSPQHVLGTTNLGKDIFSQLVIGTRSALFVGVTAAFCVVVIGTVIGLIAGYFRGWPDMALMRLADLALGIPFLPFVIVLAAFLQPSIWNVIAAMGLLLWSNTARVVRSQVLLLRERAFVEASRVAGSSNLRILFKHIAPNILPLSFLYGSIAVGWAILAEASVSFLGFGDSNAISWGYMLQDAYSSQALSRGQYYWFLPPGICIVLVVVAGFFVTRGYEELLFPKLRE